MPRRRLRYDIYSDILETVRRRGASNVTRISYGANLPVDRAKQAVLYLEERGLLKEEEYGRSKVYRMTAKGGEFLHALRTVKNFLGDDEDAQDLF
jgi:predicted transcriptional regulator